jgi:hypothetical protein
MSTWKDIAKKGNEVSNVIEDVSQNKPQIIEKTVSEQDENIISIQEELEHHILDTYGRLIDELDEGLYSFILEVNRPEKMSSFIKMIHKNINYKYYLNIQNSDVIENETENVDEFVGWENKKNKFAYI